MIKHDEDKKMFFMVIEGQESHLLYRFIDKKSIDIYSTFVHQTHRGQGIAKKLVETCVEFAKNKDLKIKPSCSYVKDHFDRTPELKPLLLESF